MNVQQLFRTVNKEAPYSDLMLEMEMENEVSITFRRGDIEVFMQVVEHRGKWYCYPEKRLRMSGYSVYFILPSNEVIHEAIKSLPQMYEGISEDLKYYCSPMSQKWCAYETHCSTETELFEIFQKFLQVIRSL